MVSPFTLLKYAVTISRGYSLFVPTQQQLAPVPSMLISIRERHYATPDNLAGKDFRIDRVRHIDLDRDKSTREIFCKGLKMNHVSVVEISATDQIAITTMWSTINNFFSLPEAAKSNFGPLHESPQSDYHYGQSRSVGYTNVDGNAFLDTRLRNNFGASNMVELVPVGLDTAVPGFTEVMVEAQRVLFEVGLSALSAVTAFMDDTSLQAQRLADSGRDMAQGATCATVHRFVRYEGGAVGVTFQVAMGVLVIEASLKWCQVYGRCTLKN
jgi:hypothetical protein